MTARTLGQVTHRWAHDRLWLRQVEEDVFDAPDLRSSWLAQLGGMAERSGRYPSKPVIDRIERRVRLEEEMQRLMESVSVLKEWQPHGHLLYRAVMTACLSGSARADLGRGWRHQGDGYRKALEYFAGSRNQLWDALTLAWDIVAALMADGGTLAEAEKTGMVEPKTLTWARERGLLDERRRRPNPPQRSTKGR